MAAEPRPPDCGRRGWGAGAGVAGASAAAALAPPTETSSRVMVSWLFAACAKSRSSTEPPGLDPRRARVGEVQLPTGLGGSVDPDPGLDGDRRGAGDLDATTDGLTSPQRSRQRDAAEPGARAAVAPGDPQRALAGRREPQADVVVRTVGLPAYGPAVQHVVAGGPGDLRLVGDVDVGTDTDAQSRGEFLARFSFTTPMPPEVLTEDGAPLIL